MKIQRVIRDLVATHRIHQLQDKTLRVVEDYTGDLSVALDPVGTRPGDFVITMRTSAARYAATGDKSIPTDLTIGGIIDHWSEERWRDRLRPTADL
jgi:ethanolamine utilization protein EutN